MEFHMKRREWLFLLVCLGLGYLAEVSFLHGEIGLSYLVFISGFYLVIFLRIRLSFSNRRIGLLIMMVIWVLSGSYVFYDNILFHNLNLLIIPILVFVHIVLITRPNSFRWDTLKFMTLLSVKLREGIQYSLAICKKGFKRLFHNMNAQTMQTMKRIIIGLAIGVPLLLLITGLLMSADVVFQEVVLRLPQFILQFNFMEGLFRFAFIILSGLLFFGVFQVLYVRAKPVDRVEDHQKQNAHWDSITAVTILVMLNSVYVLFAVIQFTYFFSDGLTDGFTYAEYARKGFFELVFVTLINWTILTSFLKLVQETRNGMKRTMKLMYSLLIIMSGILLASAYQRLSMYEAAYGFTLDRILAHAFMIFLMVIFAYTFIRVWMERISLLHFYLIAGLIFYTVLNAVNIEQIVVDNNLERYEQTGKADVYYLDSLSYTGWDGLIELYEMDPDYPDLQAVLQERQQWVEQQPQGSWQSFNFKRQKVTQKLEELDLTHMKEGNQ